MCVDEVVNTKTKVKILNYWYLMILQPLVGIMIFPSSVLLPWPGHSRYSQRKNNDSSFTATLTNSRSVRNNHSLTHCESSKGPFSEAFYTWLHIHKQLQCTDVSSKQHTDICSHLRSSEQVAARITRNAALDKGQCWEGLHKYTEGSDEEVSVPKQPDFL